MGGRGASFSGNSGYKLRDLSGSVKQIKYAKDIIEGSYKYIESAKKYEQRQMEVYHKTYPGGAGEKRHRERLRILDNMPMILTAMANKSGKAGTVIESKERVFNSHAIDERLRHYYEHPEVYHKILKEARKYRK